MKDPNRSMKRQVMEWKKMSVNHTPNKEWVLRTQKYSPTSLEMPAIDTDTYWDPVIDFIPHMQK